MILINEYIKECHEIAITHGWWGNERSIGEIICLFHSEVSEILEEYRKHKKFDEIYYVYSDGYDNYELTEEEYQIQVENDSIGYVVKTPKPEGISIEFADLLIRIFDWCGKNKLSFEPIELNPFPNDIKFCNCLADLHGIISDIYNLHINDINNIRVYIMLYDLICWIYSCVNQFNIPIEKALDIKIEYNKTRSYRHGNKKL